MGMEPGVVVRKPTKKKQHNKHAQDYDLGNQRRHCQNLHTASKGEKNDQEAGRIYPIKSQMSALDLVPGHAQLSDLESADRGGDKCP